VGRWGRESQELQFLGDHVERVKGPVRAEGDVGDVEVSEGGVIVLERGWVLGEVLWVWSEVRSRHATRIWELHTSSFSLSSFSCLKRLIFVSRRAAASVVEAVEKVLRSDRYRS